MEHPGSIIRLKPVVRSTMTTDSQALEGAVESKIFGNERVWVVPDDGGDPPQEAPMPTNTREQPAD